MHVPVPVPVPVLVPVPVPVHVPVPVPVPEFLSVPVLWSNLTLFIRICTPGVEMQLGGKRQSLSQASLYLSLSVPRGVELVVVLNEFV